MLLALLLSTSLAHADADFDRLRDSFSGWVENADQWLSLARELKPHNFEKGAPISKTECEKYKARIKAAYNGSDPWKQMFDVNRSYSFFFCDVAGGFYTPSTSYKTELGLQAVHLLQETTDYGLITLALNENFKIIEIQKVKSTGDQFEVMALAASGNIYTNQTVARLTSRDIDGPATWLSFDSGDGTALPISKYEHVDSKDPSKSQARLELRRADARDWDLFELPLTYAEFSGFYVYGKDFHGWPTRVSWLTIYSTNGRETCAEGLVKVGDQLTTLPADLPRGCD